MNVVKTKHRLTRCMWIAASIVTLAGNAGASTCQSAAPYDLTNVKSQVIMLGELHGTNEFPALASSILCSLTETNRRVIFGLEISKSEQKVLTEYMNSSGGANDRQKLLRGDHWARGMQDGRSSHAMFKLIEAARQMRASGAKVMLDAFSSSASDYLEPIEVGEAFTQSAYEALAAAHIESRLYQYPDALYFVFVGRVHASKQVVMVGKNQVETMAYQLNKRVPVHSITANYSGGTAWTCNGPSAGSCAARDLEAYRKEPTGTDFDTYIELNRITVSPPMLSPTSIGK